MSRNRNKKKNINNRNNNVKAVDDINIIDFDAEDSSKKAEETKAEEIETKEIETKEIESKEVDSQESQPKENSSNDDKSTKPDSDENKSENTKSENTKSEDDESDNKDLEKSEPEKTKTEKKETEKIETEKTEKETDEKESEEKDTEQADTEEKIDTEEIATKDTESPKGEKPKNKILKFVGRFFAFLGVTLLMLIIGLYVVMWICTKGPSSQIKELFVLSVRESSAGGFLADIYLSPDEIAAIEEKNKVEEVTSVTDTSIVQISKPDNSVSDDAIDIDVEEGFIAESMFDVNVYTENGIEFHEIAGTTFTGIAMVVADPSRVFIGTPRDTYDGGPGISVPAIADRYGAIAATNGGFFVDTGGHGDGGTPIGAVFSHGKMVYGSAGGYYSMMGFNEEGVLICGSMSGQQAIDMGIRDGLQCNPFLIINGEPVNVGGKGGGLNPRTALGQRADGAVVLLTIDGRQASSLGASMSDMVDVMLSFDVVNAGNLDGGGSTVLYYDGEIRNVVMSIYGARGVPNAVCVAP